MKLKLVRLQPETDYVYSYFWQPDEKFDYLPGQYLRYTLPTLVKEDPKGKSRFFTISSSPTEDNLIRLTTSTQSGSGFKETLMSLSTDSEIEATGPFGQFTFDSQTKGSHIFLAGGIGITPFRSMLVYSKDKKLEVQIRLLYSVSSEDQIPFWKEFEQLKNISNIHIDLTITKPDPNSNWRRLTGRIDENMLLKHFGEDKLNSSTIWICGPDAFTKTMISAVKGKDHVKTEVFTGY